MNKRDFIRTLGGALLGLVLGDKLWAREHWVGNSNGKLIDADGRGNSADFRGSNLGQASSSDSTTVDIKE